jgi:hypothetical protein
MNLLKNCSGTLLTATSEVDTARGILVKSALRRTADLSRPKGASDVVWERNVRKILKDDLGPLLQNNKELTLINITPSS